MLLFSKQFCRHLWTDLYQTLTRDAYRSGIERYWEIFVYRPPLKNLGPQNYLFWKTSFFRFCWVLNRSLPNFNTWRVLVGNRTLRRDFWVLAPNKIWGLKATNFWWVRNSVATLRANISGEDHDSDSRDIALETTRSPYIVSRFHELCSRKIGPLFYPPSKNSAFFYIAWLRTRSSADRTQPNFATW